MTTTPHPAAALQRDFEHAWADLGARLNSGLTALENMSERVVRSEDRTRLSDKSAGLNDALDLYEALNADHGGDFAGAWRALTDRVTALFVADGKSKGYYQGAHLALTYQRGYAPHIDAPVIANPHLRR